MAADEHVLWSIPGPPGFRWTLHRVAHWLEIDAKTLRSMIEAGLFPRGHKPSPGSEPEWTGAELAAWLLLRSRWYPEQGKPGETRASGGKPGKPGEKTDEPNSSS